MNNFFAKLLSFLKKDFLMESSYRLSFFFNIFTVLVTILGYYFIDVLFGKKMVPHLETFGAPYLAYVLLSLAMFSYVGVGLGSFASRIQSEQVQGTLEAVLVTPTPLTTILASLAIWNFLVATMDFLIYLALGLFVFHIDLSRANILSSFVVLALTVLSFSSLGILSASFVILFKRGNPVSWIINSLEGLLGGVYFPVTVLPAWLQAAAKCLPITYAIQAIQLSVYRGYSLAQLWTELRFLLLFSAVLCPLSLFVFGLAIRQAKKNGSLAQY